MSKLAQIPVVAENFAASKMLSEVRTKLTLEYAMAYWRKKVNISTAKWNSLREAQHAYAFTTAGLMQADFLNDMRKAMDKVVLDGGDLEAFMAQFDDIVTRSGWNHYGGRDWRTSLIYRQNTNTAWSAGRFVLAMQEIKEKPYMKRVLGSSKVHRPEHVKDANTATVYPVDSSYWNQNMPPYWRGEVAFNCDCKVITLSESVVKTTGFRIENPKTDGEIVNPGKLEWLKYYQTYVSKEKIPLYPPPLRTSVAKWFSGAALAAAIAWAAMNDDST